MLFGFRNRARGGRPAPAKSSRLGYLPGLDGLRALAVLAVLAYHADVVWLPGGFLGVEIFFVVSGYLITSLLLAEYRTRDKVSLKNFWMRRARRLLPALFAMIIATLVYMVLVLPDEVASIRGDVIAAFTYITNWYLIAAQKSYFETIGRPSVLQHLWSLAVEEQFYLAWPIIFVLVLTRLKSRGAMLLLMLGATASALWMGILYHPDADPSRVYYGTDTRAAGLLIGAALAFVWTPQADGAKRHWRHWLLDAVGFAAIGGLIFACLFMDEFNPFLYQGGLVLVSAATALVIAAVVHPKSPLLAPVLGLGILQWIGLRSYSLYLWHYPLFMITRPQLDTTLEGAPLLLFRFGITFVLAELSYRVVESPIRGGILGRTWNAWTQTRGVRKWSYGTASLVVLGIMLTGILVLGNVVAAAQAPQEPDYVLSVPEDLNALPDETATDETQTETGNAEAPVTSDMVSVSFVSDPQDATAVKETHPQTPGVTIPVIDSWLTRLKLVRTPVIYTRETDFDSAFRRNTPRNQKTSRPCNTECITRLDTLEWKKDRIKFSSAPNRTAVAPRKPAVTGIASPLPPRTGPAQVLAIGDSVMLGASNYLRRSISALDVDAKLGRQVSTAIRLLQEYKDDDRLAPIIVIHLGNNGTFNAKQFDELMTVLGDRQRVVFLTTKVPRKWQDTNNTALSDGVKRYANAMLIDWNNVSTTHSEWFWKDGIHLNPQGAQVYANLIAASLENMGPQP